MSNFKNKTVWITGASSGIGEAVALEFAKQGAKRIVLSARREEELRRVAAACTGSETLIQPLDLGDFDSHAAIVQSVLTKTGGVDILVNNAGLSQRALVKDTHFEVDKRLIEVNLLGTISLSKAILPHFLDKKQGHFVVVTSLMGKFGAPLRSSYAAAKHGLHGFFDSLRVECWQENVQVTLVCPGFVQTDISRNALTADGSSQGTMDEATEQGITPEKLAKAMLKAVHSGKEEIYVGGKEVMATYLKRFFPGILSRVLRKAKVT